MKSLALISKVLPGSQPTSTAFYSAPSRPAISSLLLVWLWSSTPLAVALTTPKPWYLPANAHLHRTIRALAGDSTSPRSCNT